MKYTYRSGLRKIKNSLTYGLTVLVLSSSSTAAVLPLLLSQKALATPATYTTAPFTTSELSNWSPDRTTPSGGYSSTTIDSRSDVLHIGVDNTHANTSSTFYQTEGLQRQITASDTIKADLYVDSAWTTNHVRAGLWGVAKDNTSAISAYPILEFTANNGGFTGWRAWDGVNGGWTDLPFAAYHTDSWNTVEISLNPITHQFNLFVNGVLATSNAGDVSTSLGAVILNDYNYATNNTADNYSVNWSNFAYGTYLPVTPTTTTISGNTSAGENQSGWMFNRDPSTSTPFNFTTAKRSTGTGSLYVQPIGTNPADKFVAEDFTQTPVSDLNAISYDYQIAGNGTATSAKQFYLNVYANIDSSNKFYDCRFDYVPTTGSTTSFSTAQFTATDTPSHVQQSSTARTTCPTTLAGMPAGSYIRMFSLSVGDTTANDTGLAGYLDNVVVNKISGVNAYNFDPTPRSVAACTTTTPVLTTDLSTWDFTQTRATGHYALTADGLHIYTEGTTSTDKVAGYYTTNFPLSGLGTQTIAQSLDYQAAFGTAPGLQLAVDFDNNGTIDGLLVGESVYGNNWWLTNSSAQFIKDSSPNNGGGNGSPWYGTPSEWLTNFPNASVKAIGFSLGSGVYGDGVIKHINLGCHDYTFGLPDTTAPVVTLTNPSGSNAKGSGQYTATGTVDELHYSSASFSVYSDKGLLVASQTATAVPGSGTLTNVSAVFDTTSWTNGRYTVVLTATDTSGNTSSTSNSVTINNNAQGAPFTGTSPRINAQVQGATTGEITTTLTPTAKVKGDTTNTPNTTYFANDSSTKNLKTASNKFLGLGWWWLAVLAVLVGFFLFLFGRSSSTDKH